MSKRPQAVSVLTANRLQDGIVVFLAADGRWAESIDDAVVARTPHEAQVLGELGACDAARNLVVEPYLAEVREAGGRLVPVRTRERVRVDGPSILGDVPGYEIPSPRASSPSPRAASPSPRSPSGLPQGGQSLTGPEGERGEGRGEGQHKAPTQTGAALHPGPLPASGERGKRASEEGSPLVEAA